MKDHEILKRTLEKSRKHSRAEWSERVESGLRVEAERRDAGRAIRRRGGRTSQPVRDRLSMRFPD